MSNLSSRALVAIGALCLTLGVVDAEAARTGARPAVRSQTGRVAGRGAAKPIRTRQVRALRPAKKQPARRALARKPIRTRRTPARQHASAASAGGGLSVVKSLIGAVVSPAEALLARIATSFVKYRLQLQEHNPFTGEMQTVAMTQTEEVALGAALASHLAPSLGIPLSGRPMERYLDAIVGRLVRANGIDRVTPYRFKVHLVHSDVVNAFGAPGGAIVVTTGLLQAVRTEAGIALILAHEIGHVVARHGSQSLAKSKLVTELLTSLGLAAGNDLGAQVAVLQGALDMKSLMLSYSRHQEHQSDTLGVRFLAGAGYSARGVEEMAGFLHAVDGGLAHDDSGADHPSPAARTRNLVARALEHGMTYDGDLGADRFAAHVAVPLALGIF